MAVTPSITACMLLALAMFVLRFLLIFFGAPMTQTNSPTAAVMLDAADLPAFCPNPAMPVWSSHPRVFLDLSRDGQGKCPYCGTEYRLKPGAVISAH